jgi:hypothetical protein
MPSLFASPLLPRLLLADPISRPPAVPLHETISMPLF